MQKTEKWSLIIAVWVIAVALLLGAFKGRFERVKGNDNRIYTMDTWSGRSYETFEK